MKVWALKRGTFEKNAWALKRGTFEKKALALKRGTFEGLGASCTTASKVQAVRRAGKSSAIARVSKHELGKRHFKTWFGLSRRPEN